MEPIINAASHIPSPEKAAPSKTKSLSQSSMTRYLKQEGEGASPSPSRGAPSSSPAATADMPYLCDYQGCTFRARTKFEMSGHR